MDFIWAILFYLWFELWSLPPRVALAESQAPPDVRRFLSRVVAAVPLALVVWGLAHRWEIIKGYFRLWPFSHEE